MVLPALMEIPTRHGKWPELNAAERMALYVPAEEKSQASTTA